MGGGNKLLREKTFQCYIIHHKFHMYCPGIESRLPQ